jgi:hypothetical protein
MITKPRRNRKKCIYYGRYGKPCGKKMGTYHCDGVTKCLKFHGWYKEKEK